MSYCFSNIYFFSSASSKVVSTLLSSGINRVLCETGTGFELESAALFLPGCLGGWADPHPPAGGPWSPVAGSGKVAGVEGVPGWLWTAEPRAASGQVQSQTSQGTVRYHRFLQAVRAQRNLIDHLVQLPLFVGEPVEVQRVGVTCSLTVTCQVSGKATRPWCLQSPPSAFFRVLKGPTGPRQLRTILF